VVRPQTLAISAAIRANRGFTLLELLLALVILGLLAAAASGAGSSFYSTMEYREAVRELSSAVRKARMQSRVRGEPIDLVIDPDRNRFALTSDPKSLNPDEFRALPGDVRIDLVFAAEVSPGDEMGAIRFYPDGGASGGEIRIERPSGAGTLLIVDWLLGDVRQEKL